MSKEVVETWSQEKKIEFLKEGNRRVFYQDFAFYYSYADDIAQLVISDYRTGHINNYYCICQIDTSRYDEPSKKDVLMKILNRCLRRIHHDADKIELKNM